MGHRIMSFETFTDKPESECNKRLSSENFSFDDANKRPKQDFVPSDGPFFSVNPNAFVCASGDLDSSSPWFTSKPSTEVIPDSLPVHFDNCEKSSQFNSREQNFFPIYGYVPRKAVPVGLNHQADIPELNAPDSIEDDSDKWIQTFILPNPDMDSVADNEECDCVDMRSVRCIRQHITEKRENLKNKLGMEKFMQLGFGDMGEEVAVTWDPQDEKLFAEVVRSNPSSFTKNFWDILPLAFPDKCKRDFVSYYFNVYMLRKRAGQNRSDPLYIDSDDDEWEGSEDRYEYDDAIEMDEEEGEDGEEREEEEEEGDEDDELEEEGGSGLESPIDHSNNHTCQGDDLDLGSDVVEESHETRDGKEDVFSEKIDGSRGLGTGVEIGLGFDVQDDSCTSFDVQHNQLAWDIGFDKAKIDELLPTCNVIEEVFGEGSCEK
ncbi:hypothetical protein LUZ63_000527 [Rhynchospora breviuscula]|uniref:Uncharacterized protein n=1 Tax=Rhynchospora breviuscula TaxID=2022672 RepID=A0A9Q0CV32_9POAL|nr:hypothetical protein LUZ63_000527 [Rhynchospora breviuscula]